MRCSSQQAISNELDSEIDGLMGKRWITGSYLYLCEPG